MLWVHSRELVVRIFINKRKRKYDYIVWNIITNEVYYGKWIDRFYFYDVDVIDSRQVAEMVGKEHKNLLRDISGYIETMAKSDKISQLKIEPSDFYRKYVRESW